MKKIDNYPALTNAYFSPDGETRIVTLLSYLSPDKRAIEEAADIVCPATDWEYLLETAITDDVEPLLYGNLQKMDGISVPEEVLKNFRYIAAETLSSNLSLMNEAAKISEEGKNAGVRILFIKGPVMVADVYKEPGKRSFSDIDILVSKDDSGSFEEVLRGLAYSQIQGDEGGYRSQKVFQNDAGVTVDLQVGLIGRDLHNNFIGFDFDETYNRSRRVKVNGKDLSTLGLEDALIYYALHLAMHHSFQGLRWFVDIHEFVSVYGQSIKWGSLLNLAARHKTRRPLYYALYFTQELYGTRIPEGVMGDLERVRRKVDRYIFSHIRERNKVVDYLSELFMFDSLTDTVKFVFRSFMRYPYMLKHFAGISYKALKGK